jgi:hypothetical protein
VIDVLTFIYNSDRKSAAVDQALAHLEDREEPIEYIDTGTDGSEREAMLVIGESTRVGSKPDEIFDDSGNPDFSMGVLIAEQETGRRDIHIGDEMLEAL